MLLQVNTGAGVAGGAECKLFADGAGGNKFRFETRGSSVGRVIKDGTTTAQIHIGITSMLSFVSLAADLECYVDATPRTMALISGALATWPATPAGTTYVGAFVGTGSPPPSSNGVDGLLGEWLITVAAYDRAAPVSGCPSPRADHC